MPVAAAQQESLHVAVGSPPGLKRRRSVSDAKSPSISLKRQKSDPLSQSPTRSGPSAPDFNAYLNEEAFQTSPSRGAESSLPHPTGEASWDMQPAMRDDFIQHEPAGMFSEQSSTVPDTQGQARIAETPWSDLMSDERSQGRSTGARSAATVIMSASNAAISAELIAPDSSIRLSGLSHLPDDPLFETSSKLPGTPTRQDAVDYQEGTPGKKKSTSEGTPKKNPRKKSQKSRASDASLESLPNAEDNTFVAKTVKQPRRTKNSPAMLLRPPGSGPNGASQQEPSMEMEISTGPVSPPDRQRGRPKKTPSVTVMISDEQPTIEKTSTKATKSHLQPSIPVANPEPVPPVVVKQKKGRGRPRKVVPAAPVVAPQVQDDSVESVKSTVPSEPEHVSQPQAAPDTAPESQPVDASNETPVVEAVPKVPTKEAKRDTGAIKGASHRVGLSRRVRIAPLLKVVRK